MSDRWLDKDQQFYNYRTSEVDGHNIFDEKKGSNSYAQNFIDNPDYLAKAKNKKMEIVQMTPKEYWEICAEEVFDKPVSQLMHQWRTLDAGTLDHITQVIKTYNKRFPITYIDHTDHKQDGLHRMIVAGDLYGWDTKFPVMVIDWVDKELAAKEAEQKHIYKIENYIDRAIKKALRYTYYNLYELKDQLYSELSREFMYEDEFENKSFKLDLLKSDDENEFKVVVNDKYSGTIPESEIHLEVRELDVDDDWDDLDIDDIDDNWLSDILHESTGRTDWFLRSKDLDDQLKAEFGDDYASRPICRDVCRFVKSKCPNCQTLEYAVGVWKNSKPDLEPISVKGHCVIMYDGKIYDYTSHQYDDYGFIPTDAQPRVLIRDDAMSQHFNLDFYRDKDYIIIF